MKGLHKIFHEINYKFKCLIIYQTIILYLIFLIFQPYSYIPARILISELKSDRSISCKRKCPEFKSERSLTINKYDV